MKVTSAVFLKSAFQEADWPHDGKPEIAFLGRSNVGKSSLINSLLGVRGLARTSNTPGRTQSLNFYLINDRFRLVDLPGYGYAKAPKALKAEWGISAENYLAKREQLVLSIHLVDSRHEPSKQDLQLHEWLKHNQNRKAQTKEKIQVIVRPWLDLKSDLRPRNPRQPASKSTIRHPLGSDL